MYVLMWVRVCVCACVLVCAYSWVRARVCVQDMVDNDVTMAAPACVYRVRQRPFPPAGALPHGDGDGDGAAVLGRGAEPRPVFKRPRLGQVMLRLLLLLLLLLLLREATAAAHA